MSSVHSLRPSVMRAGEWFKDRDQAAWHQQIRKQALERRSAHPAPIACCPARSSCRSTTSALRMITGWTIWRRYARHAIACCTWERVLRRDS